MGPEEWLECDPKKSRLGMASSPPQVEPAADPRSTLSVPNGSLNPAPVLASVLIAGSLMPTVVALLLTICLQVEISVSSDAATRMILLSFGVSLIALLCGIRRLLISAGLENNAAMFVSIIVSLILGVLQLIPVSWLTIWYTAERWSSPPDHLCGTQEQRWNCVLETTGARKVRLTLP